MLREILFGLARKYTSNEALIQELWHEIEANYAQPHRYYHNLSHLENLFSELIMVQELVADWDTMMFAVFYHDLVYEPTNSRNEEDSAVIMRQRLTDIGYPEIKILHCSHLILATKVHGATDNADINYFTDADLSILGKNRDVYITYVQQIRKEYSIFPDMIYNPGRSKVLKHFLEMAAIYKTTHFYSRYEKQARENIAWELTLLS
ncbi:MAG: hypothetical protein ITG00_00280 [Flavobacterium sp.]|nr:hypothetical protein [Flavobacterium sp.]